MLLLLLVRAVRRSLLHDVIRGGQAVLQQRSIQRQLAHTLKAVSARKLGNAAEPAGRSITCREIAMSEHPTAADVDADADAPPVMLGAIAEGGISTRGSARDRSRSDEIGISSGSARLSGWSLSSVIKVRFHTHARTHTHTC